MDKISLLDSALSDLVKFQEEYDFPALPDQLLKDNKNITNDKKWLILEHIYKDDYCEKI